MTTKSPFVVVQFAHKDFKRCQIIDRHLSVCHPSLATIPLYPLHTPLCSCSNWPRNTMAPSLPRWMSPPRHSLWKSSKFRSSPASYASWMASPSTGSSILLRSNGPFVSRLFMLLPSFSICRIVGFDELGNKDDFSTQLLEKRLAKSGEAPSWCSIWLPHPTDLHLSPLPFSFSHPFSGVIAVDSNNTMVKPKSQSKGITGSTFTVPDDM